MALAALQSVKGIQRELLQIWLEASKMNIARSHHECLHGRVNDLDVVARSFMVHSLPLTEYNGYHKQDSGRTFRQACTSPDTIKE